METKELNKVLEQIQETVFTAMENGASKEDIVKQLDYVKYEVENSEDED